MYTKRNLLDSQGFEDFVVLRSVISLPNQYNLQERTLSRLRRLRLITMKKIGIVGVGCISGIYLENITKRSFSDRSFMMETFENPAFKYI